MSSNEISDFLRDNLMAFMFEWHDLCKKAQKDLDNNMPQLYTNWRIKLETTLQHQAKELWDKFCPYPDDEKSVKKGDPPLTSLSNWAVVWLRIWNPYKIALHMSGKELQPICLEKLDR